jgi:site-specific DNA recombinase
MAPTYTMSRGSRHRYYVSQAQLRGKPEGSRPRIGADDVERLIVEQLCRRQRRNDLATDITNGVWSAEARELILTMVDRVIVHHDEIEVAQKIKIESGNAASIDGEDKNEGQNTLRLPLPPPRPRERREILIPGNSGTQPRRIDQALILALARARSWMRALRHAEFVDTAEIAQRFALSNAHVRRPLRLAYLAPDIVEAIVEGRQPRT